MNNGGLILTNICGQAWKGWTHTTIPSSPIYTTIDLWLSNPVYLYHSWPMLTYMAYTFPIRPYILTTHNVPSNFPWFHTMSRLKVQLFPPPQHQHVLPPRHRRMAAARRPRRTGRGAAPGGAAVAAAPDVLQRPTATRHAAKEQDVLVLVPSWKARR